jgi:hypothetical protein
MAGDESIVGTPVTPGQSETEKDAELTELRRQLETLKEAAVSAEEGGEYTPLARRWPRRWHADLTGLHVKPVAWAVQAVCRQCANDLTQRS